jgi:hypothetical protein
MTEFKVLVAALSLVLAGSAHAQIYRWTDADGRVNFSNKAPPPGVRTTIVDPDARVGAPSVESTECYTIRCQGERMEERERRREAENARFAAERAAIEPKRTRGLEFRKYISITRGMSEGEVLGIAGDPDLKADHGVAISAPTTVQINRNFRTAAREGLVMKTYTYMPVPGDPFVTTITLVGGRVSEIERVRKF